MHFPKLKRNFQIQKNIMMQKLELKIGNQAKNVKWNDFEHIMGNYDITQKLYEGYRANTKLC